MDRLWSAALDFGMACKAFEKSVVCSCLQSGSRGASKLIRGWMSLEVERAGISYVVICRLEVVVPHSWVVGHSLFQRQLLELGAGSDAGSVGNLVTSLNRASSCYC